MNKNNFSNLLSLDVEADGPCPGLYSMVSFALVSVEDPDINFYTTLSPISDQYVVEALNVCNFTRDETLGFTDPKHAIEKMQHWIHQQNISGRPIIWSDNPAFDWQFLNYYCHKYLGSNPFGHSARRIGDYYSGLSGHPRNATQWKKLRDGKHTHNALDDARGNATALKKMLLNPNIAKR